MENILHDFEEKVISLMTEFLKNSMETGGLSNFTEDLKDNLMQLGYDLTKFSLEYAEDINKTVKEVIKKCEQINLFIASEDEILDEDTIIELDNLFAKDDGEEKVFEDKEDEIEEIEAVVGNQKVNNDKFIRNKLKMLKFKIN